MTGPVGTGAGFSVELAGLATDNADATRIDLSGLTKDNGLQIVVTPNKLASQPGSNFATLYSAGYTNVLEIVAGDKSMTNLGGIQLSAAIVHSTKLTGVAIGTITLDPGQAPYVDRINTQNNQQATDSTMYNPVTGLIHLGGIIAASVDSLVIDGAISAKTNNPNDLTTTNDFRSVIESRGASWQHRRAAEQPTSERPCRQHRLHPSGRDLRRDHHPQHGRGSRGQSSQLVQRLHQLGRPSASRLPDGDASKIMGRSTPLASRATSRRSSVKTGSTTAVHPGHLRRLD